MIRHAQILYAAVILATPPSATAAEPRLELGQCVQARIAEIGSRIEGEPDSGTNVMLTNGISAVSYKTNQQATLARVGDQVLACLVSQEPGCPKGDDRGRVYTIVDLRTHGSWTLPNDEHSCGGA